MLRISRASSSALSARRKPVGSHAQVRPFAKPVLAARNRKAKLAGRTKEGQAAAPVVGLAAQYSSG
jgi:hypothetical protein